ncbi:MAG: MGMT family protein [Candidatus Micrarchaeia archaeon]
MENSATFSQKVYAAACRIPKGKVSTYAAVARAIGKPGAARAVGNALRNNPHPIVVPCHRVVRSDGRVGGYGGRQDSKEKIKILKKEGVKIKKGKVEKKYFH